MKTVSFSAIKGGVGKSSLTILMAKYISQVIKLKTLVIDLDFQNSTSFHFAVKGEQNIADALFHNQIRKNIIVLDDYLHIVQSSLRLTKMGTISPNSLKMLLQDIKSEYDWCIIDTPPNYNNIVLNGLFAADLIVTPVTMECFFDRKTAVFFREQLEMEYPELLKKWKLLFTKVRKPKSENSNIIRYENSYLNTFHNFLNTKIPETKLIPGIIDTNSPLHQKTWEKVLVTITELYDEIDLCLNTARRDTVNEKIG